MENVRTLLNRFAHFLATPWVIVAIIVALVVIQVETQNTNGRVDDNGQHFTQRLCVGSNAARVQLNRTTMAISDFLHQTIKLSAEAQKLQPPVAAPPALNKLRVQNRIALHKLLLNLQAVKLTNCNTGGN